MFRGVFAVSVLAVFCYVILFPSISISSVPAIVGQDDGGSLASPVSLGIGDKSNMPLGHKVKVNVITGNAIIKHTDLVIPTKGKDIVIERSYNSLEHLSGVESGLDIYGQPYGWSHLLTVTEGTAWINGERAVLGSDYTINVNTLGLPVESGMMTHFIYIYKNSDNTAGINVTRFTFPMNAPTNYYYIGKVDISHGTGPEYSMQDPIPVGVSLENGKVVGCGIDYWVGDGEEPSYNYRIKDGVIAIREKWYRVNQKVFTVYGGNKKYFVATPPSSGHIAVISFTSTFPTESTYSNGFLVIGIKDEEYGRSYYPTRHQESKLGTKGKWRFNFESYAEHTKIPVNPNENDHYLIWKNGDGSNQEIVVRSSQRFPPYTGNTTKRKYWTGTYSNPTSGGPFSLGNYTIGQLIYTGRNMFEIESLDEYKKTYRGISLSINNSGNYEAIRDDAVLVEEQDVNGNKLVYDWQDGPNGNFRGIDNSNVYNRDYQLNRIYDDAAADGNTNPDSVIIKFTYNSSSYITSIVVTDEAGANPELVAEYYYDSDGNLSEYVDFHGRHFYYDYGSSGESRLTNVWDEEGNGVAITYDAPSKKVSFLRSPNQSSGATSEFSNGSGPLPLSTPGTLNADYVYDWANALQLRPSTMGHLNQWRKQPITSTNGQLIEKQPAIMSK